LRRNARLSLASTDLTRERANRVAGTFGARQGGVVLGILRIAYKLLVNDKGKFAALLMGLTFSVFLMIQMTSMFAGMMKKASATVMNTGAKVWVMDRSVTNVSSAIPMPDYMLDAVRSIDGVKYAVPLYSGAGLVRLKDGFYQPVTVLGLDDTSLFGRPQLIEGDIADIYAENGFVVVKDEEYVKLENPKMGTEFELNDNRGVIVGIAKVPASGLFGIPTLYTTFNRAVQYIPSMRYTISFILVEPRSAAAIPHIQQEVARLGYETVTEQGFIDKITNWYMLHTGMGVNLLLMTAISFVVGLSISGQTFYTFVLENLGKFGALKAIGAKGRELVAMIFFQAGLTGLAGYGLGVGLCSGLIALAKLRVPDYASVVTYANLLLALGMVLVISAFSGYIAVRKVLRIDPYDIFRG
jgi:putative ABC transport system permease protein